MCRFCKHYSKPKPSALDIAMMSFSRRTSALSYCGSTSWLKHVWASGRLSGLFVILVILNVISPIPPTGTLSLPVVNNRNFFFSSGDRAWRISQKSLEHENSIYCMSNSLCSSMKVHCSGRVLVFSFKGGGRTKTEFGS